MGIFDIVKFGCLGVLAVFVLGCAVENELKIVGGVGEKDGFVVGGVAPDFSLANLNGGKVRLSDYRGDRGVVVVFSRGYW